MHKRRPIECRCGSCIKFLSGVGDQTAEQANLVDNDCLSLRSDFYPEHHGPGERTGEPALHSAIITMPNIANCVVGNLIWLNRLNAHRPDCVDIVGSAQFYPEQHHPGRAAALKGSAALAPKDRFATDDLALAEFEQVVADEGVATSLDDSNVVPFRR